MFLLVGALAPKLNGYGTWTDFWIGIGILIGSLILFVFRRVVQDGEGVHMREDVPLEPTAEERGAAGRQRGSRLGARMIATIVVGYDESEPRGARWSAPRCWPRRLPRR